LRPSVALNVDMVIILMKVLNVHYVHFYRNRGVEILSICKGSISLEWQGMG
jgi:hypothetical protein